MSELAQLGWAQLWQVTIVASLVLVLVRVFCRHRPHLAYVLLLLVVVKCLTPPIWSSPAGVFSWTWRIASGSEQSVGATTIAHGPHEPLERNPKVVTLSAADVWAAEAPAAHANPTSERETLGIGAYLLLAWACGAVVCGIFVSATWLRHLKAIRKTSTPASDYLATLSQRIARKVGLKRRVGVLVSSDSYGPSCFGVFFPFVVLPDQLITKGPNENIEPVLAHELIHIRWGDTVVALFQVLAGIAWWFHPVMWWVTRQLSREREKCCDEEVVAGIACDPEEYARSILNVLKLKRSLQPAFLTNGIRPVDVTKQRLEAIMNKRYRLNARTPRFCWVILVFCGMLVIPGATTISTIRAEPDDAGNASVGDRRNDDGKEIKPAPLQLSAKHRAALANSGAKVRTRAKENPFWDPFSPIRVDYQVSLDQRWKGNDNGLRLIAKLQGLEALSLRNSRTTDTGVAQLSKTTSLRAVNLAYTKVSDGGMQHLRDLNKLEVLVLDGTRVGDVGLKAIEKLSNLRGLSLRRCRVTDDGLKSLSGLSNLQLLDVAKTNITDDGLKHLKDLKLLVHLGLSGTDVSDKALMPLSEFSKLRVLSLASTRISNRSSDDLESLLAKLSELKLLSLPGGTLNDAEFEFLREKFPKVTISK